MDARQFTALIEALNRISEGLQQGALELFISPLVATFVGALSAFALARWQGNKDEERRSFVELSKSLALKVANTQEACTAYWSGAMRSRTTEEDNRLAGRVTQGFASTAMLAKEYKARMPPLVAASEISSTLDRFCRVGYQIATDGDFQEPRRDASQTKINAVAELARDVDSVLWRYI